MSELSLDSLTDLAFENRGEIKHTLGIIIVVGETPNGETGYLYRTMSETAPKATELIGVLRTIENWILNGFPRAAEPTPEPAPEFPAPSQPTGEPGE